jgi:DNA-binding transcriptional MerR regulator
MHADLSSGDLAKVTGHTVRTIRFYEEQRLLVPAVVSDGGHRRYTKEDVERLQLIADLRELGLPLGEIRSVLELRAGCHTAAEFALRFQGVLASHLEQAQRRLERLRRVKRELQAALASVQARLLAGADADARGQPATPQCACAVAADRGAPRIVKVLARQPGCCGQPGTLRRAGDAEEPPAGLA